MIDPKKRPTLTLNSIFQKKNPFQVVALEKNQINFDVFPIMDLPHEILLKILSYLPTNDILKRVALVSRKFYQISQDKHLLTKIEFEFKNHSEVLRWSDDQVDKYYNDFLEVVKESPKLKILSIKVKGGGHRNANLEKQLFPRQRQFFDELSLIKNQCVEEFCLKPCSYLWINHFVENVFGYLDKCPKLKIIKLHKISLFENLITAKKCLILNELKKTKLKTIEEFHFTFSGARLVAASLKSLLEIVLEKPNIKRIYLTRQNAEYRKELYQTCLDCGLGKNVKVVRDKPLNPGYSSVVLIVLQS